MSNENPVKKQIKFAVVMYGGGSLAIYINGVAQELLRLAHATNPVEATFNGTTQIYRKIALLLSGDKNVVDRIQALRKQKTPDSNLDAQIQEELKREINVDFIIDVLTGSSAGGINSVFLAKALVNGTKDMSDLQRLWLEQGDFAKLLNDRKSVVDNALNTPIEPASLLNSQRMYLELLKALDGLDIPGTNGRRRCQPIDLYVTYTDFEGLPTNLALADKTVQERVHKRVFKFSADRTGANDFKREMNPFLAFAARCTSSFPFAFEPMRLTNIDEIIDNNFPEHYERRSDLQKWQEYFDDLTDEYGRPVDWTNRWFVDGGCLDNKPFGYAIDKLTQSAGEGIVERKLIYIEPNPESFRTSSDRGKQPNAIENVFAQASGLPSYETIREDLRRVLDRNRLIERVNRLTADVESDFAKNSAWLTTPNGGTELIRRRRDINWSTADLSDVGMEKGPAFIPYYRLRVGATTDYIAGLVTRFFQLDVDSDFSKVLRRLIRTWRETTYSDYRRSDDDKNTLNKFLYDYDVEYRLRRLRFVLQKTDYLLRCKDKILEDLEELGFDSAADSKQSEARVNLTDEVLATSNGILPCNWILYAAVPGADPEAKKEFVDQFGSQKYVNAVLEIQKQLTEVYRQLRSENDLFQQYLATKEKAEKVPIDGLSDFRSSLRDVEKALGELEREQQRQEREKEDSETPRTNSVFARAVSYLSGKDESAENEEKSLQASALNRILRHLAKVDKVGCSETSKLNGKEFLTAVYPGQEENTKRLFESLKLAAEALNRKILNADDSFLRKASSDAKTILGIGLSTSSKTESDRGPSDIPGDLSDDATFVRSYLAPYYQLFDSYDQISLPVFFESPVGEAVPVDVIRISSRDAHSLINEEDRSEERRKLAGDYLFSFGAFLDPRWRLNDIMWGRLDGAERLITTLIPEEFAEYRQPFIDEANQIIISEMLLAKASATFQDSVVDALTLVSSESIERDAADKLVRKIRTPPTRDDLTQALTAALGQERICDQVKSEYEVNRRLEPKPTLETISRATQIIGKIFQRVAEEKAQAGERIKWVARLGQIFWGLVTVAAPNGILNSVFNYWIQLIYLFETILLICATVFASSQLQQLSIILLILSFGLHLSVMALQETMLGEAYWKTFFRFLVAGVLVAFVVLGGVFLFAIFFSPVIWEKMLRIQEVLAHPDLNRWRKLLFVSPFLILIIVLSIWREAQKRNLRIVGRAIIAGFLTLVGLGIYFAGLPKTQSGNGPLIELEFVRNSQELGRVINGSNSDGVTTALWLDSFIFVPVYLGVLLLLCAILKRRRHAWAQWLGIVAGVLTVGGAVADWVENYFSVMAIVSWTTDGSILLAAQIKWSALFAAVGLLAAIFWRRELKSPWNGLAALIGMLSAFGIAMTFIEPVAFVPNILFAVLVVWFVVGILFQFDRVRRHFSRYY